MRQPVFLTVLIVTAALAACSPASLSRPSQIGIYYTSGVEDVEPILAEIENRRRTIEAHPSWISLSTADFMIKNLEELPETDYARYSRYLDDEAMYIIVHPAYYVFFHNHDPLPPADNPFDSFLAEATYTKESRFLQEQERALRDFLEITSTRKRLVLLVLPGNYRDYSGYIYRGGLDEFARYINIVTNESESVLYLYSEEPRKGDVSKESKKRLSRFIESVNPATILIGGGYVGRCLENFYKDLAAIVDPQRIMIAAEISAISPEDISALDLGDFLKDGRLNIVTLKETITGRDFRGIPLREVLRNYRNLKNAKGHEG